MHKKIFNTILKAIEQDIKLPVRCNTIHSNREIFEILLQTSFLNQFVETTVEEFSCYTENVCSADTVIKRVKTYGWKQLLFDYKTINFKLFNRWIDRPKRKVYIAIDYHDIPRFLKKKREWKPRKKKCDDIEKIVCSRKQSGTHTFHRIISADIVEEAKFTVDFEPVFRDVDQGTLTLGLLENAQKMINIKAVLFDRGFFKTGIINLLQGRSIPFIIRAIRTKQVNRFLQMFKRSRRAWAVYDYEINKTAHGCRDRKRIQVKTTLVIVDSSKVEGLPAEKYNEEDRYFLFVTNLPVRSQETAFQLARDFRKRWQIETGYKTKKQFRGKTCSLSYAVRLFFVLLSFVLYNLWISINSKLKHRVFLSYFGDSHLSSSLMAFLCIIHILSGILFQGQ